MNEEILNLWGLVVTPWKIIGFLGVALFAGRWFVQLHFSHKARKPTFPLAFWYMSLSGSLLVLSYFIFGKNDSVGILSNLSPALIAGYNLFLEVTHRKRTLNGNGDETVESSP